MTWFFSFCSYLQRWFACLSPFLELQNLKDTTEDNLSVPQLPVAQDPLWTPFSRLWRPVLLPLPMSTPSWFSPGKAVKGLGTLWWNVILLHDILPKWMIFFGFFYLAVKCSFRNKKLCFLLILPTQKLDFSIT